MRTTAQSAALAVALALGDRTDEAAHELMQLGPGEQEEVRRALVALLLVCEGTEEAKRADG